MADETDDFMRGYLNRRRAPGASVAILKDGKVVKAAGYGLANVEHRVPAKPETIYQSASVGKQFTATAVMILAEEGKLRLDDPISRYFPDAPATWNGITVRHLLNHTSGIKNYGPEDLDYRRDYTEQQLFEIAATLPVESAPGEKWSYSNTGYVLLGILIRKVSGEFYGDFLRRRVFQPLEMTTARVMSEADIVPNRAAGYVLVDGQLKHQEWVSPSLNTTADGSLYLSVLDLAKWDGALYTEKLLKRATLEEMWTAGKTNDGEPFRYGLGWAVGEVNGRKVVYHNGNWQGFVTHIARYLDEKLTVIILTNLGDETEKLNHAAQTIAGFHVPALAPRE